MTLPLPRVHFKTIAVGIFFASSLGFASENLSLVSCRTTLAITPTNSAEAQEKALSIIEDDTVPTSEMAYLARAFHSPLVLKAISEELSSLGYTRREESQKFLNLLAYGTSEQEQFTFSSNVIARLQKTLAADQSALVLKDELLARERRAVALGFDLITYGRIIQSFQEQASSDNLIPRLAVLELVRRNSSTLVEKLFPEETYWQKFRRAVSPPAPAPPLEIGPTQGAQLTPGQANDFDLKLKFIIKMRYNGYDRKKEKEAALIQLNYLMTTLRGHLNAENLMSIAHRFYQLRAKSYVDDIQVLNSFRELAQDIELTDRNRADLKHLLGETKEYDDYWGQNFPHEDWGKWGRQ